MKKPSIALLVYSKPDSVRNALTEEKYKYLANAMAEQGFHVESVSYHDSLAKQLENKLQQFQAVLVWVNPIEQGNDRRRLDSLLTGLASKNVLVSTHPEIILKIGTKDVLYFTRHMDWGGDIDMYTSYEDFSRRFLLSLNPSNARILKQYRGNGGDGVFKVSLAPPDFKQISLIHAITPNDEKMLSQEDFLKTFRPYFENNGLLINQNWMKQITNGMVRCYLTGGQVSGFGYQEFNALCPESDEPGAKIRPPSKRFYYSEHCGLFRDLRHIMETKWVPELLEIFKISEDRMPLLWDADFFINDVNANQQETKYTLCEINVSCVSPFPESCISHIIRQLKKRLIG